MQVTKVQIEPCTIGLQIEVEIEKVKAAFDKAYKDFSKVTSIPGFRPGKAPRSILEKQINQEKLQEHVTELIAVPAFREAVAQENIEVYGEPEVDFPEEILETEPYKFSVKISTPPVVNLGDLTILEVERPIYTVNDEDVNASIEALRNEHARLEKVENRAVEEGDVLIAETSVKLEEDDTEVEPRKSLVRMGDNIPGFDEAIIGMNIGEEREFSLPYPEDFQEPEKAGKNAHFTIKVDSINKHILPELNDLWVSSVTPAKSVLELRMLVRESLETKAKSDIDELTEARIVDALVNSSTTEFSSLMVETDVDNQMQQLMHELSHREMTYDDYLSASKLSKIEHQEKLEENSERRVKTMLVMRELALQKNVEVSQQEIINEMIQYAGERQMGEEDIRKFSREESNVNHIANRVIQSKLREILFDAAKITEVPAAE